MARVIIDGGSTAAGYNDDVHGGWAGYLRNEYMRRAMAGDPKIDLVNRAILSKRIPYIVAELPGAFDCFPQTPNTVLALMVGASDVAVAEDSDKPAVSLTEFSDALSSIADTCEKHGVPQVFVSIPPIDGSRTMPYRLTGNMIDPRMIERYTDEVERHVQGLSSRGCLAAFVDVRPTLSKFAQDEVLASDGLHPTARGHREIGRLVVPVVDEFLRILRERRS